MALVWSGRCSPPESGEDAPSVRVVGVFVTLFGFLVDAGRCEVRRLGTNGPMSDSRISEWKRDISSS